MDQSRILISVRYISFVYYSNKISIYICNLFFSYINENLNFNEFNK